MANINFILNSFGLQAKSGVYVLPAATERDEPVGSSLLGNPVMDNLNIEAGTYRQDGRLISYSAISIDSVVFVVSQTKEIVITKVAGRAGSVKEYISEGDYQIQIQGAIVSPHQGVYPQDEVDNFIQVLKSPVALGVVSKFLQLFNINDLVITDYGLPQQKGYENVQLFQINALSDIAIELELRTDEGR